MERYDSSHPCVTSGVQSGDISCNNPLNLLRSELLPISGVCFFAENIMGGGVMRTAAKVAGVGVVNAGLRGAPAVQPVEQPMAAAARKATVPVSSVISSAKLGDAPVSVQRPSWELDDWEFASVEEEINIGTGEPLPRVVFGGVPTLQEAKEATSELKDALDQLYLSPSRSIRSGVQQLGLLQIANSDHLETKACVATTENTVATVPAHAIQAFAYLKDSPAAQNVVASIASDPNVWSAVMQNEALVEFLQAQKTCAPYPSMGLNAEESVILEPEFLVCVSA
ncbi:unnamed protein product, partial [Vitis vinifera]